VYTSIASSPLLLYLLNSAAIRLSSPTNKPYHLCSIQSFKLASYDEEAFPCVLPNDIDQVITNADMVEWVILLNL